MTPAKLLLPAFFLLATAMLVACSETVIKSDNESNSELGIGIFAKNERSSDPTSAEANGQKSTWLSGKNSGKSAGPHASKTAAGISHGMSKGISRGIYSGQSGNIISGTSLTGAFAGTFEPYSYTRALQERIKESWKVAPGLSTKSGVVTFAVDHTGSISALFIKESSGSKEYDRSMLGAVEHAVPLPPLVASAPAKVQVEFSFNERLFKGLESKEDMKKIIADQEVALARNPDDCRALSARAKAHMRLGDFAKAIADYKVVISKSQDNVAAYVERAKCYLYIDDYKNAIDDCLECQKLEPSLAKPYTLAAAAQVGLGHLDDAQRSIDISLNLDQSDPEAWAMRANCDNLTLKHKAAIADATKAITIDPEYGSAYAYRGDAFEALKDYDAALRDYTKNVDLAPGEAQAFMRRTELYSTLGKYDKAVFDATEAIKLSPQNAEAYYYRSHANEELGLKAQAQQDLARAKQLGL